MSRKGRQYKYLTEDMRRAIYREIKKVGRDELYKRVEYNIMVNRLSQLQNEDGAFNEIKNGPWRTTQWEYKFYKQPIVIDSLESEILYYISKYSLKFP